MAPPYFYQHGSNELGLDRKSYGEHLDFSVNINPWGPPESVASIFGGSGQRAERYPDIEASELKKEVARFHGIKPAQVLAGNGSSELIYLAAQLRSGKRGVIFTPAFSEYERALKAAGCKVRFKNGTGSNFPGVDIVFLGNPNNPTGVLIPREDILEKARSNPKTLFVTDEVFMDFSDIRQSVLKDTLRYRNLIVICSLTKLFAVPGLRIGYAAAHPKIIEALAKRQPPWSVNALAQEVGKKCLKEKEYIEQSKRKIQEARASFFERLSAVSWLKPYPSQANFILCEILDKQLTSTQLQQKLFKQKILIRNCDNFRGLVKGRFIRLAVRKPDENEVLIKILKEGISTERHWIPSPPHLTPLPPKGGEEWVRGNTKFLMVQGTGSSVGKSVITTALCRFFQQEGFRVAPFKAQNMSNNSYVTKDGGEIGRAQAVQAQACGIDPTVHMNPVLLKPTTDIGAQVIVHGRPIAMMKAREYQEYQSKLIPYIEQSLEKLKKSHDLIIIEGAGSPAEVNLYQHDIVNMKIARMTGAPVILVGDIELGGVFASLVGTLELLPPQDRGRVKGFLINKFRGDLSILEPGLRFLEERTGLPVLGVLPYDAGLRIEEEDGVFWAKAKDRKMENGKWKVGKNKKIQIHVVELPRISNHTDFEPLMTEPDVELKYIREVPETVPDVLILPGTRSTIADLEFLKRQGLFGFIQENVKKGMRLVGICGGYQMLGEKVIDLDHVESHQTEVNGFGLFPSVTKFSSKKLTAQVRAIHVESNEEIKGYEIHMGLTEHQDPIHPMFKIVERSGKSVTSLDGAVSNRVWGSYIHGLFDAPGFRRYFLNQIRAGKGWSPLAPTDQWDRSIQFDRLAEMIRQHVKMESLYEWLGFTGTLGDRRLPVGSSVGGS